MRSQTVWLHICGLSIFMSGQKGHRTLTPNTSILSHQWAWGSAGKEHELFATIKEFVNKLINKFGRFPNFTKSNSLV